MGLMIRRRGMTKVPEVPFDKQYLTFEALEAGTFQCTQAVSYSINEGAWTSLAAATSTPTLAVGDTIRWKASNTPNSTDGVGTFSSTGQYNAYGNPISMRNGDSFRAATYLGGNYIFCNMFRDNTHLINAENIALPITDFTSSQHCYGEMFYGCTGLVSVPELPATTLNTRCYSQMFYGCTSLTTPMNELPATTVAVYSYANMFDGCISLTKTPIIRATTANEGGLSKMFYGCTSLVTAYNLQITTFTTNKTKMCEYMFAGCTSLTTPPSLPATTLAANCYYGMFQNSGVTSTPALLATNVNYTNCYRDMFYKCASLTTINTISATGTLGSGAMQQMFRECTSLTSAAITIGVTTIPTQGMHSMFYGCSNLVTPPTLSATTVSGNYSMQEMFRGCSKLSSAPTLPTNVGYGCFQRMFWACTTLETAPDLLSATTTNYCYNEMFRGCTKLKYVKCLATNIGSNSFTNWLYSAPSGGTFVKHPDMTSFPRSASGIPSSWTVVDAVIS